MDKEYYIYILASKKHGTLYIGVTNDLIKRIWLHKQKRIKGFTRKYDVDNLVYYEVTDSRYAAIQREKRMKEWKRIWKIDLIEQNNPDWDDLYEKLL